MFKNGWVGLSFIRFPDSDSSEMSCSKGKIVAIFQEGKDIETENQRGWCQNFGIQGSSAPSVIYIFQQRLLVAEEGNEIPRLPCWHRQQILGQNSEASLELEASLCYWLQLMHEWSHAEPLGAALSHFWGCKSLPADSSIYLFQNNIIIENEWIHFLKAELDKQYISSLFSMF